MADAYKRLGAEDMAAATDTSLYTVPGGTEAIVSSVVICNRTANVATVRLAHVDGAIGAVADEDYIIYDDTIPANGQITIKLGISMEAADSLLARSDIIDVTFIAWGVEKS